MKQPRSKLEIVASALERWVVRLAVVLPVLVGCQRSAPKSEPRQTLTVFAAASLREVFTDLATEYRALHPQLDVAFNFAGTQELRTQVEQGATSDVFAGADTKHVAELVRRGFARAPVTFAENVPVLVVAKEARRVVESFADLANVDRIVLGAPDVPIGRYSLQILEQANAVFGPGFQSRVESRVVSRELNVRQVLGKVVLGEAGAGIVYRTDIPSPANDEFSVVEIPTEINVVASYQIAITAPVDTKTPVDDKALPGDNAPSTRQVRARQWVEFVTSDVGRRILQRRGFSLPTAARTRL